MISVVVPVYNVETYLNRCVNSIIEQDYKDIQIILVDDGSTDNSRIICDKLAETDNRIQVIHQENKGLSEARNAGIKLAKGDYISFIDSDDYISPKMIGRLYELIVDKKADIACCGHYNIYGENDYELYKEELSKIDVLTSEEALSVFLYTKVVDVVAWNKLYRIDLFDDVCYLPGKLFEDHFTTYKLLMKADKIVNTTERLYYYCKRSTSIGGSGFSERSYELKEALDAERDNIISGYPLIKDSIEIAYVTWLMVLYNKIILAGKMDTVLLSTIRKKTWNNLGSVIKNKNLSFTKKIQIILLLLNRNLYKKAYCLYIKQYR